MEHTISKVCILLLTVFHVVGGHMISTINRTTQGDDLTSASPPMADTMDTSVLRTMTTIVNVSSNMQNVTRKSLPQGLSFFESLRRTPEYVAARNIQNVKYVILLPLAFVGNLLTLMVMGKKMTTSSSSYYIGMVAIWDTMFLSFKTMHLYFHKTFVYMDVWGCRSLNFLLSFSAYFAVWLVVAMTFERFLAVAFPFKASTWCTVKRAIRTTLLLAVACAAANLVLFWTVTSNYNSVYKHHCVPDPFSPEFAKAWSWLDASMYSIVPVFCLFILNLLILHNLAVARARQKTLKGPNSKASTQASQAEKQRSKQRKHLTVMLLTVSVVFTILTIPYCVLIIGYTLWPEYKNTVDSYATQIILNTVCYLLTDINHCANFFLYFLSAARFRKDLAMIFQRIFCKARLVKKKDARSDSVLTDMKTTDSSVMSSTEM